MGSAILALLITLAIGGVLWYLTARQDIEFKLSTKELVIGSAICLVTLLIVGPITEHIILNNEMKYYEYYNGYEVAATTGITTCERDGSCDYTYNCDPYTVQVSHTYTDSDGDSHTYYTTETRYHHCPYLTQEYDFTVATTLGNYPIGGHYAMERTAWRGGMGIPDSIPEGPPALWQQAKDRIAAGKNGGVTQVHSYQNFLLASDKTILDQYSDDISRYLSKGLLTPHTVNPSSPIYNEYQAGKIHLIDLPGDGGAWQESLMRLNGYFGAQLQGDIHMVAINASKVTDRDNYAQALFAYWKSPALGKYALSKNAIGIVVGVKDSKVVWARATNGMPVGNEALLLDIQNNLVGIDFTPDTLIGLPLQKTGALYKTLYGAHKYSRPHNRDYEYLKSDVTISGWQRFWIVFVCSLLGAGMWGLFLAADDRIKKYNSYY